VSPGQLEVKDGHVTLDITNGRWKPFEHAVEMRAHIAGYHAEVLPAGATMDWSCALE
jgi:hypothetical protein